MIELAIIGAGASGLTAAIRAGKAMGTGAGSILLLERLPRVGKKILVTGNGRCNLSNHHALAHPYHNKGFAAAALAQFGPEACEAFFDSLGLALWTDAEGRVYPRSNTAASVLDALRYGALRAGAELRCDCPVWHITRTDNGFLLNNSIPARQVIIATGGCAAPEHGSDGSGFVLLRSLGHNIVEPEPALVQIKAKSPVLPMLKGLRVRAVISIGEHQTRGEILFAKDGISGIAAMEVSRWAKPGCSVVLDLLPEFAPEEITALLMRWQDEAPELGLAGLLPRSVGEAVLKTCGNTPSEIARACKAFRFEVTGTRGFASAQVTAGGADVRAFDPQTLQSRLVPGLYACGEALDVDGGCGGYNLHWAWASGVMAAACAVASQRTGVIVGPG
jgi:predicted Rossmann fold flavoprotein